MKGLSSTESAVQLTGRRNVSKDRSAPLSKTCPKEGAMLSKAGCKSVRWILLAALVIAPTVLVAQQDTAPKSQNQKGKNPTEATQAKTEETKGQTEAAPEKEKDKVISGMSILGNQEAPKALVIVPWKSSELGKSPGISTMLDDSRQPIDKEVFMRALSYYELRSK